MTSTACFMIISKNDIPIYEAEVGTAPKKEEAAHQHQFILHAALDIVQDLAWTTSAMFLKAIDRFNDMVVSVYVTAGHTRLMLLHDSRNDDGIKSFFQEVHELYIKILLNPLYLPGSRVTSSHFDTKVRALARRARWIVMPCQISHSWYDEVSKGCSIPVLHMGECVAKELKEAKLKPIEAGSPLRIGVLATNDILKAGFYQDELQKKGFEVVLPDKATMEHTIVPSIEAIS